MTKRRVLGTAAFAAPKERHNLFSPGCVTGLSSSHFNAAEIGLLPYYTTSFVGYPRSTNLAPTPLPCWVSKTASAARYGDQLPRRCPTLALPKFESYAPLEKTAVCGPNTKFRIEWFHGIGRLRPFERFRPWRIGPLYELVQRLNIWLLTDTVAAMSDPLPATVMTGDPLAMIFLSELLGNADEARSPAPSTGFAQHQVHSPEE